MFSEDPFVGRVAERTELLKQLEAAASGRGGVTLVGGEAGSGKSALLRSVLSPRTSDAPAGSPAGFFARCPGPHETPPFGPWAELVDRLRHAHGWDPAPLPRPFGEAPGQWGAYELAGALGRWFGHRGLPLVLVVEDLHWADAASLDVLRHLTAQLADWPVRVICTYRTDELSRRHPLWSLLPELQRSGAERIALESLSPADVRELTAMLVRRNGDASLIDDSSIDEIAALIFERTKGLALFVREMLQLFARTGELPKTGDPLPQNLHQAIDSKLQRLPPAALKALEAAAVIGERFSFDVLAQVADMAEDDLSEALEAAVARHVIRPLGTDGERFTFDHALYREAILVGVIGSRRRRWHARIAAALEATRQGDADTMAYHWAQAGDPQAVTYLVAAADQARRLGARAQAAESYKRALSFLEPGDPRRAELLLLLGWCLREKEREEALSTLREAEQEGALHGQAAVALWARHFIFLTLFQAGEKNPADFFAEVKALMAEEESLADDPHYRRLEAELYGGTAGFPRVAPLLIRGLALSGQPGEAQAQLDEISRRTLPGGASDIAAARTVLALLSGRLAEAADQSGRAADHAHSVRHYRNAIYLRSNELLIRLIGPATPPERLDLLARQLAALEQEAWQECGYAALRRGFSLTGIYQCFRGDWKAGYHHVVEGARREPDAYAGTLVFYAASILESSGDARAALPFAEAIPPLRPGDPFVTYNNLMTLPHSLRAQVYIALGDLEQARVWLEAAERWPALPTAPFFHANVLLAWSAFHAQSGDLQKAWEAARRALAQSQAAGSSLATMRSLRRLGELAAALGTFDASFRYFQESVSLARRCRFPLEEAHTLLARGRSLLSYGSSAGRSDPRADLESALAIFEGAGALPCVEMVRQVLHAAGSPATGPEAKTADRAPEPPTSVRNLTQRQLEVIALVCQGLTDREIAGRLYISPKTVDRHLRNIFNKTGVSNRAELAAFATRHGLDR